jgi:hypothetical protein
MKLKPAGLLLGSAGNVALAWGLYHLLGIGSCGGEYPACPSEATPYFIAVPVGIIASILGVFLGGGGLAFVGIFGAVGAASLLRGFNGGVGPEGDTVFPFVFGGFFIVPALLPLLLMAFGRRRLERAERLVAEGRRGIATVTRVDDTGITINDNPRVKLHVRIEPEDGSAPFEGEKAIVVSRVAIPRAGDRYPAWYDAQDPSNFGLGTEVEPHAPADVRALLAKAAKLPDPMPGTITAVPVEQTWVTELGRLNDLRLQGALTDEEFARAKDKLLASS